MIIIYKQCAVLVADLMLMLQSVFYHIIVSIRHKLPTQTRQQQLIFSALRGFTSTFDSVCLFVRVCACFVWDVTDFCICLRYWFTSVCSLGCYGLSGLGLMQSDVVSTPPEM